MLVASLSSQEQMILHPPVHFSILMVQRGTIIMLAEAANPAGAAWPALNPGMPRPASPEAGRSNIIVLDIPELLSQAGLECRDPDVIPEARPSGYSTDLEIIDRRVGKTQRKLFKNP